MMSVSTQPPLNRRIEHPGPCTEDPIQTAASRCLTVYETLRSGQTILEAFSALLKKYNVDSAVARLESGCLFPASYVLPALSTDPNYAVYYSKTFEASAPLALSEGAVTIGLRDQKPWLHCHARWTDGSGQLHCGHLLPEQTYLAQDTLVELTLLIDAAFVVCPDEHTRFSLFKPSVTPTQDIGNRSTATPMSMASSMTPGVLVRVAPNVDFGLALLEACARHDINTAFVYGGVGSVVGAVFDDGREVEPVVTELMVRRGYVDRMSLQVTLDIALIDYTGTVSEGCLALGNNPVLVTCELVLVPTPA